MWGRLFMARQMDTIAYHNTLQFISDVSYQSTATPGMPSQSSGGRQAGKHIQYKLDSNQQHINVAHSIEFLLFSIDSN